MPFDKSVAARMADFVQFAYRMYFAGGLKPAPDPGLVKAGYKLRFWLTARDFQDTRFYGYLAQSITNPGNMVLAIRGTENASEWILDFASLPVFFHADAGVGSVALGFQSIQQSFTLIDEQGVSSSLADAVARLAAEAPIQTFNVLGHSLGAALATLAAAELAARNTLGIKSALAVYTYASPRVGLLDFASWFHSNIPVSYRIWNLLDVVPEVPTFPFIHVGGLGDSLVQTQEQLRLLPKTPQSEHNLANYQWLLDPVAYPQPVMPATPLHAGGAQLLHKAVGGRG